MLVKGKSGENEVEVDVDIDQYEADVKTHFEGKGIFMKTKAELDADKADAEKRVSTATSSAHTDWEKTMEDLFGTKKPAGAKGLDWAKSTVSELKKKAEEKKEEVPDPNKKVDEDKRDAELKSLKQTLEDLKKSQTDKEAADGKKVVTSAIRASTKRLSIVGDSEAEIKKNRERLEKSISADYDWKLDSDDELTPYDADGNVVVDPETQKPYAFEKLAGKEYAVFLKKAESDEKKLTGTGTGQSDVNKEIVDPKKGIKRKSEEEIRQFMREHAMVAGSQEWKDFLAASLKLSGLTES